MKIEKNIAWDDVKKKYYVTLYFGKDDSGAIIKKTVTTTNKKEAHSILREHNKKMEAGTAVTPNKTILVEYARECIEYKALTLAQTTIYGYKNILKNHITPYFNRKYIQDITPKDIQDYITAKASTGISLQSVKKHVALLYSVFQNAYRSRIINENPIDRLERIKAPSSKMECMNALEIAELCRSLIGTQLEVPVKLAAYLGLRRGEVLGLKWEHVDFDNSIIRRQGAPWVISLAVNNSLIRTKLCLPVKAAAYSRRCFHFTLPLRHTGWTTQRHRSESASGCCRSWSERKHCCR